MDWGSFLSLFFTFMWYITSCFSNLRNIVSDIVSGLNASIAVTILYNQIMVKVSNWK